MKLVVLEENTACCPGITAEHGLSLYLETETHRILFDMGQTNTFAENAAAVGVDLARVDFAVISHGHYDHTGGLTRFLELNSTAPVYLSPFAPEPHYNAKDAFIGMTLPEQSRDRLVFCPDGFSPAPGMILKNTISCAVPIEPYGLQMEQEGRRVPEDFRHEQYLEIREGNRRILVSGCSHRGIQNISRYFFPDVLIGGFHLMKQEDSQALSRIADDLLRLPTVYYTGHCTGQTQYAVLKERMGSRLHRLSTGMTLNI